MISNIRFANPEQNEVAILHANDFWIKNFILRDIPSTTIGTAVFDRVFYVTPVLIARTILNLRLINWNEIKRGYLLKDFFMQIYAMYVLACIGQINAKVVLTFVDNSSLFHKLSRIDKERAYFAIQNGARTLACVRDSLPLQPYHLPVISMTNYFCFGKRDVDLFNQYGHKIDTYFPIGSLIGGYYKSVISTPVVNKQYDLCLISQWHEHFFENIDGDSFHSSQARRVRDALTGLNDFLQRLLSEVDLSLVICTRNINYAAECEFYKNIFGDKAEIAELDRKNMSTYHTIDKSKLAIALNSTTLSEVISWGQKSLWCNVPNDEHYEMPQVGISYFCGDDYSAFKERVLKLLMMPQDKYEMLTSEGARYINNYDPNKPPQEIIRSSIQKILSSQE